MRVLRAADYRRMPWKNGGGETFEIAVGPESAGLDDFDWRLSMARVAGDGPFSAFPGIDRTLTVLDGGLALSIDGRLVELDADSDPHRFPGGSATSGQLVDGPVTDFNVMTRAGQASHHVVKRTVEREYRFALTGSVNCVFCASGSADIAPSTRLHRWDCAFFAPGDLVVRADGPAVLIVVEISTRA